MTVTATNRDGVLHPAEPLGLADGEAVSLTVTRTPPPADPCRAIREARTFAEWEVANQTVPADPLPPGYDILEALNQNRIDEGREQLFPVGDPRRKPV